MNIYQGSLLKMASSLGEVVNYTLKVGSHRVDANSLIGKQIKLQYLNEIYCIGCGRKTSKSFAQGYCYPCLLNSPETDTCILRPETCRAHEGVSRDMEWSKNRCLQNHVVYLSDTTGLKVGVTRVSQIPIRWIDQGATSAILVALTPNRFIAGSIEVFLKDHFSDITNWRNMLTNRQLEKPDLLIEKSRAISLLPDQFKKYISENNEITTTIFPVRGEYPQKVTSLTLDKNPEVEGTLKGIKGQYLIFESGEVLNIRRHNGYKVSLTIEN